MLNACFGGEGKCITCKFMHLELMHITCSMKCLRGFVFEREEEKPGRLREGVPLGVLVGRGRGRWTCSGSPGCCGHAWLDRAGVR